MTNRKPNRNNNLGFTMFEMVISLALTAIVATMIYGGLDVAGKYTKKGDDKKSKLSERSIFFDRLSKDIDLAQEVNPETCVIIQQDGTCNGFKLEMIISTSFQASGDLGLKYVKYLDETECREQPCLQRIVSQSADYADSTLTKYYVSDWNVFYQDCNEEFPNLPQTNSSNRICISFKEGDNEDKHKIVKAIGNKTNDLAAASFFYISDQNNGDFPGLSGTPPDVTNPPNDPNFPSDNTTPNGGPGSYNGGPTYTYQGGQNGTSFIPTNTVNTTDSDNGQMNLGNGGVLGNGP